MAAKPSLVRLVGVPHFRQGGGDALCTLYSMAMILTAMLPSKRADIYGGGGTSFAESLLLKTLKEASGKQFPHAFLSWFRTGASLKRAQSLMNRVVAKSRVKSKRLFRYESVGSGQRKLDLLLDQIRNGLPVLFGGTGDLAGHAVVAVGFDTGYGEIGVQDPGVEAHLSWYSFEDVVGRGADFVYPTRWPMDGPPLDKVEFSQAKGTWVSRWDSKEAQYLQWGGPKQPRLIP